MPSITGPNPFRATNPVIRLYNASIKQPSHTVDITTKTGLKLHHASELLNWGAKPRLLKIPITKRRINKCLELACGGHSIHFWLHPFDLVEAPGLYEFVEASLRLISAARDNEKLDIALF